MINRLWTFLCLLLSSYALSAQDSLSFVPDRLAERYVRQTAGKLQSIDKKVDPLTDKVIRRVQRLEAALQRKLSKVDSAKAATTFGDAGVQYSRLSERLAAGAPGPLFIPSLDTLDNTLRFLSNHFSGASSVAAGNIKKSMELAAGLGGKLAKAEELRKFLRERRQFLKQQLQSMGFARQLKRINRHAYYYGQHLSEYKAMLKDHRAAERKLLDLLSKTPAFRQFMRRNSMLTTLFRLPDDPTDPSSVASLAGLQTRAEVTALIQQQIGISSPAAFQQTIQDGQAQLQQLKDKVLKVGAGSSDDDIAEDFKPNEQRTKRFGKRIEYGFNVQTQKATNLFPVTSDLGLSLGFKINDKSIVGVGACYKMGWGSGWRNINLTSQGLGLRSFVDWKLKGSFWLSGGYEQNYIAAFNSIDALRNRNPWQQSGLLGLSKVVSLKTKFFRKTKLQLLWDFLCYQQRPRNQPVVFRLGYTIR